MTPSAEKLEMTRKEYLEWEETQPEKHEFVAGEVFCQAGAKKNHNIVAGNLFAEIRTRLKGSSCQTFIADMRIQIDEADCYFYPDVLVTCSKHDNESDIFIKNPCFIAEVLSESTASWDYNGKFDAYRKIPEFREYMLLDPDRCSIQLLRKNLSGVWLLVDLQGKDEIVIESLDVTVERNQIFEGVAR